MLFDMGNREALLEGAKRCLLEKGYAKTTARDIADAAGVSLAAIGYHYGSKESLLEQAFMAAMEEWFADEEPGARESAEQSERMGRSERSEPLEPSKQRRRGEEAPSGEAGEPENRGRADAVGQAGRAGQARLAGEENRADEAESTGQAEGVELAERAESAGRAESADRADHVESTGRADHVESTGRAERVERAESADLDEQADQAEAAGRAAFATGRPGGSLEEFRTFFEGVIATFPHQRPLMRLNLEMGLEAANHPELGAFMSSALQLGREGLAGELGGLDPERDGELAQQVGAFYSVIMTGIIAQYLTDRERFPSASDLAEGLRYIAERALKA
jgi:AcrR family transcriptional regulator